MPGYILHLLHGKLFLDQYGNYFSETEKNQFAMGLLMPDSNKAVKKKGDDSHFYSPDQADRMLQIPDLHRFPYIKQINNPFVLGYAAHLYLDSFFFSDFFLRFVRFLDEKKQETLVASAAKYAELKQSGKLLTISELFSDDYLYGDYTMLNRFLIDKYHIKQVAQVQADNPINEVDLSDFKTVQTQLRQYLSESSGSTEMRVFSIKELESAIERYAYGFGQWIDGINCILKDVDTAQ